jgi:SAM-dependent methyltransferase
MTRGTQLRSAPDPTDTLERLEREVVRLLGGPVDRRLKELGRALAALHARFVAEVPDESLSRTYFDDRASLAAYLAYFHPASIAQVRRALAEAAPPPGDVLRVLDVGSGPGSASAGVAEWAHAHGRKVRVTALEASPAAVDTLMRIFPSRYGDAEGRRWLAGEPLPVGPFDVVVASHMLNELFLDVPDRLERRTKFVVELSRLLSPGGLLVLVEPALRRTGRELLVLRDRLLQQGNLFALAPCLSQGDCPATARPRDWCHADRPWSPPPLVVRSGDAAGLSRGTLKYSYVILSNAHPAPERTKDRALFRIVSEPLEEKGKLRFFGCGPSGRHALVRLDRERSTPNAAFDSLERGDLVRLGVTTSAGDGTRVGSATDVTVDLSAAALDGTKQP